MNAALPQTLLHSSQRPRRRVSRVRPIDIVWAVCIGLCAAVLLFYGWHLRSRGVSTASQTTDEHLNSSEEEDAADTAGPPSYLSAPILVSYAYYEKDPVQRANLEFFLQHGWVAPPASRSSSSHGGSSSSKHGGRSDDSSSRSRSSSSSSSSVTWVFVVAGEQCSPCVGAFPITAPLPADPHIGVTRANRVVQSVYDEEEELDEQPHDAAANPATAGVASSGTKHSGSSSSSSSSSSSRSGLSGLLFGSSSESSSGVGGGGGKGPGPGPTYVLWRSENVGMDFASHNVTLEYVGRHAGGLSRYRYIFLLNSSVRGPLHPAYLPPWWHWTHAFLERFQPLPQDDPRWAPARTLQVLPPGTPTHATSGGGGGASGAAADSGGANPAGEGAAAAAVLAPQRLMGQAVVRAVGSSLVCLPEADAGGPGPRLESWAVALDAVALQLAVRQGVFRVRTCKTCADEADGIVVGGEYGMSAVLLAAGHNIATLMSKYARNVDWRDRRHWGCNDMVHPSRHGTYDGIGFHPYETIFVKSSWHVADPYTRRYSTWATQHKEGDAGTEGEWNEKLYRYAISSEAQQPNLLEAAYNVERVRQLLARQREAEAAALEEEGRQARERAMAINNM